MFRYNCVNIYLGDKQRSLVQRSSGSIQVNYVLVPLLVSSNSLAAYNYVFMISNL